MGSSVVMLSTGPSTCELLASSSTVSRSRRWWAANRAASQTWPSSSSPSLTMVKIRASDPRKRSASANPSAAESPWPSDPQV